jgi:hypothetical protein
MKVHQNCNNRTECYITFTHPQELKYSSTMLERREVTHNVFCVDNKLMVFGGINGTQNQTVEYLDLNPNQGANGRA